MGGGLPAGRVALLSDRQHLTPKHPSFEPDLNQRPKDFQPCLTYSPPLYQLSYRRVNEGEVFLARKACDPPFSLQFRYERRKPLLTHRSFKPLPGGLVARIRRFHRRGPGSIPGQGTLGSAKSLVTDGFFACVVSQSKACNGDEGCCVPQVTLCRLNTQLTQGLECWTLRLKASVVSSK